MEDDTTDPDFDTSNSMSIMLQKIRAVAEATVKNAKRMLHASGIPVIITDSKIEQNFDPGELAASADRPLLINQEAAKVAPNFGELFYIPNVRSPESLDKVAEAIIRVSNQLLEKPGLVILGAEIGPLGFASEHTYVRIGLTSEADAVILENIIREEKPFGDPPASSALWSGSSTLGVSARGHGKTQFMNTFAALVRGSGK